MFNYTDVLVKCMQLKQMIKNVINKRICLFKCFTKLTWKHDSFCHSLFNFIKFMYFKLKRQHFNCNRCQGHLTLPVGSQHSAVNKHVRPSQLYISLLTITPLCIQYLTHSGLGEGALHPMQSLPHTTAKSLMGNLIEEA